MPGQARIAQAPAVEVDEVARQRHDIARPLLQRQHVQVDDVQPVVEILAEALLAHQFLQVHRGSCDEAQVDRDRLAPAGG